MVYSRGIFYSTDYRYSLASELMVSMFDQQRKEQQLFVRALATGMDVVIILRRNYS